MKRLLICAAALATAFAGSAMAQSAKFTAVYTDGGEVVGSKACDATAGYDTFCDEIENTGADFGYTLANIRVPNAKELLIGLSAQVELFTETRVKGKKGSSSTAIAMAEGGVSIMACNVDTEDCYEAKPGYITLSSRTQELDAVLGGIIETCTFDVDLEVEDDTASGSATWDLDDCTVKDEEIGLALTTLAAHHFNFVVPDLPQGDYAVMAMFDTDASATATATCATYATFCDEGDGNAAASSHAFIGKTMMTIQTVRAVKGDGVREGEFLSID